jgi:hypothetical protein
MSNFIFKALWLNILHRNAVLRRVFDYPIPGVGKADGVPISRPKSPGRSMT